MTITYLGEPNHQIEVITSILMQNKEARDILEKNLDILLETHNRLKKRKFSEDEFTDNTSTSQSDNSNPYLGNC